LRMEYHKPGVTRVMLVPAEATLEACKGTVGDGIIYRGGESTPTVGPFCDGDNDWCMDIGS
jgi:hypothetical protein